MTEEVQKRALVICSVDHMDGAREGLLENNIIADFLIWTDDGALSEPVIFLREHTNDYHIVICSLDNEWNMKSLGEFYDVMIVCAKKVIPILFLSNEYMLKPSGRNRTRVRAVPMPPGNPTKDINEMWFSMIFDGEITDKNTWSRIWKRVVMLKEIFDIDHSWNFRKELDILFANMEASRNSRKDTKKIRKASINDVNGNVFFGGNKRSRNRTLDRKNQTKRKRSKN